MQSSGRDRDLYRDLTAAEAAGVGPGCWDHVLYLEPTPCLRRWTSAMSYANAESHDPVRLDPY